MTIDRYARERQIALAREMAPRAKIYLDLRFWILAREAAAGNGTPADIRILEALRHGVRAGVLLCPVSESVVMELLKQANTAARRQATATLIDELSLGVCLVPIDVRAKTEVAHFWHALSSASELYPVSELIWSKLAYAFGYLHPQIAGWTPEQELAFQKDFLDKMWDKPLVEMATAIGDTGWEQREDFERLARALNQGNADHLRDIRDFKQTYQLELKGVIDLYGDVAADVVCDMAVANNVAPPRRGSSEWKATANACKNVLFAGFAQERTRTALRTVHIQTCLHADLRLNKRRKFVANDFYDFNHAAAALGYCDAFFTEGSLRAMVTAKHVALDKRYGCRVTDDVEEAAQILEAIVAGRETAG
ncbi:MAG: hypothetical protein WDN01_02835 [Rhizomicrobium sp.]